MIGLRASLFYNGEQIFVEPGERVLGGGLTVSLEVERPAENAAHLLLKLRNDGDSNTHRIQSVKTLDLCLDSAETFRYHGLAGDDCGAASFLPRDFDVSESYHEEPKGGRSSDTTGFPYFDLSDGERAFVFGIGWTGQWSKDILVEDGGVRVQLGLCDSDFYLKPGESVRGASVLVAWGGNAVQTRRRFRSILKEQYSPKKRLGERMYVPVSIQCFDRYYAGMSGQKDGSWNTEAGQKRTVDAAARIGGIDSLWLDAAWFKGCFPHGVGNFSFHEGFPNTLRPVSDYAHANGMRFVLWFEPERVYQGTELYSQTDKLLTIPDDETTRLFNLADDGARARLKEKLIAMIRDNGVDVYRQDFNMSPLPYWRHNDEPDRRGVTEMKYIAGLYDLWDSIIEAFPEILIDNCSSGGRRLDLETAKRSITLWKSDTGCFIESAKDRVNAWSQNQTLGLSEYVPYHACAVWDVDPYTVRSTATKGVACNFDIFNPDFDFAAASRILDEVHELAPFWEGEFTPLTPVSAEENAFAAWELECGNCGAVYVFRQEFCKEESFRVRFTSVEPEMNYRLTFIGEDLSRETQVCTGQRMLDGIDAVLKNPRSSLVIKYQRAE